MENFVTIDVQGFKVNNNKFICKELAISYNSNEYQNFIIKPPFEFWRLPVEYQKQANWLTFNHHNLTWSAGSVSFNSVRHFLKENISKDTPIYVNGAEKKNGSKKSLTT